MAKAIGAIVFRLVATLFVVTFLSFLMVSLLPGDPVTAVLGQDALGDPEVVERVREELGLNDPMPVRYVNWLGAAVSGDLGESYINKGAPVWGEITRRAPVSAQLAFMAIVIALLTAVPLGVLGAYRQGRWQDSASSRFVQLALSVPNFVTGIFLIWLFSVKLAWLPSTGWNRFTDGPWANLKTAIMPAAALALTQMAIFSRLVRSDMLATLQENYILSAKAKGLSDRYVLFRHALRPSSLSLATIVGVNFGALIGGTVVIEFLFAIPGLGTRLLSAIFQRDILVIQGITAFIATSYVLINTVVDVFYTVLDPRIRKS